MSHTKPRAKPDTCQLLIWDVPKKLKHEFKKWCLTNETTMRDQVLQFLKRRVG